MLLSIASAVFLIGLFIGLYANVPDMVALALVILSLLFTLLSRTPFFRWMRSGHWWFTALLTLVLIAGIRRQQAHQSYLEADSLTAYEGVTTISVKGYVAEEPLERDGYSRWRFKVEQILDDSGWGDSGSTLLVYSERFPPRQYGDRLMLSGKLQTPSSVSGFDYKSYLAKRGIHYVMRLPSVDEDGRVTTIYSPVSFLRNVLSDSLQRSMPEPQASLAEGMLLGSRGRIPRELLDSFANTGTTHIIAISGQNFSLVVGLLLLGSARIIGRRHPFGFSGLLLLVWFYAALTGMPPSVVRAAQMASLVLLAYFVGRQPHFLIALVGLPRSHGHL